MMHKSMLLTSKLPINSTISKLIPIQLRKLSAMAGTESDVIIENVGDKGVITLNRPKALNALNLSMVRKIYPQLVQWEKENKTLVIVKGVGEKAFCSGGDVRAVVQDAMKGGKMGEDFFRVEYTMNGLIGTYKVPYIALIDGIVMGGGVGLSVHGKYRVATERTLFAMPETQIGLFPDVGGTYFLPRLKGKLGYFLALSGYRLKGADTLRAGIATHFIASAKLPNLEKALMQCNNPKDVESTLNNETEKVSTGFSLDAVAENIDHCFSADTVEEIFARLEKDGSKWANDTLTSLRKFSPTSLKVSLKALQMGSKMNLQDCLTNEYRLAKSFLKNKDFCEGVRALLIDKDQNPKWDPASLEKVTDNYVDSFFSKLPEQEELKHKL